MRILVTGGTGFLGTHLVKKLETDGHEVVSVSSKSGNLVEYDSFVRHLSTYPIFDKIFHLANDTKAGDYSLYYPMNDWLSNTLINANMLRYWHDHHPEAQLIAIGTSCSYMVGDDHLKESDYLKGEPDPTLRAYATTKRHLLEGLMACSKQHGMKWVYFIPGTFYGPGFKGNDNHFIFDFIRKLVNGVPEFWGNGDQVRDVVYVDDAVDLMWKLSEVGKNIVTNITSGTQLTLKEYVKEICKVLKISDKSKWDVSKYSGNKSRKLSTDKLNTLIEDDLGGSFKFTPLRDGLSRCVDYYRGVEK
jgi:nucleoside-diphosphate-sugar epimerase